MLFQDVLNYFEPIDFRNELESANFNLLFVNGVFHAHEDKRAWQWLEGETSCPTLGITTKTRLKLDDNICENCIGTARLIYSMEDTGRFNTDILLAFDELSKVPITCDSEKIINQINSVRYLYDLANEYIDAVESGYEDSTQAYLILSEYNQQITDKLISESNERLRNIHRDTLGSDKAKEVYLQTLNKIGFNTSDNTEVWIALQPYMSRSEFKDPKNAPMATIFEGLELECFAFLGVAIYIPDFHNSHIFTKVPLWLVDVIKEFKPESIISSTYYEINEEVLKTAKILWSPYSSEVYNKFDACYQAASLI